MSKTCMQDVRDRHAPHVTSGPTPTGYASCGRDVYVGQGACSPQALQALEHHMSRADRLALDGGVQA